MLTLPIIANAFTGALDTGVLFAGSPVPMKVVPKFISSRPFCPRMASPGCHPSIFRMTPTRSEQNPSLFNGPDGAVRAMYTAQLDRRDDEGKTRKAVEGVNVTLGLRNTDEKRRYRS